MIINSPNLQVKLDRDERYLCPHGNEQVEAAVDLEELREEQGGGQGILEKYGGKF